MNGVQIRLDAADGQAQRGTQVAEQADDAHADAPLPQHLTTQIQLRAVPALAVRTEAFDDPMFDDLDRLRLWEFDHLTRIIEALALQAILAVGTALKRMLDRA